MWQCCDVSHSYFHYWCYAEMYLMLELSGLRMFFYVNLDTRTMLCLRNVFSQNLLKSSANMYIIIRYTIRQYLQFLLLQNF